MALIAATGKPLPKFIPSFAWFLEGVVTKGFGKKQAVRDGQDGDGPPQVRSGPPAERGHVGRDLRADRARADEAVKKGRRALAGRQAEVAGMVRRRVRSTNSHRDCNLMQLNL